MRVAVICAIFLAITVTVIEAESGRRRKMVRGDRGELRSRERKAPRRRIGAEKTSQGETGRKRKQMRRGRKLEERASIVVKGNDCEFIYLADITSNSGCSNGQKFVLKGANNTRKQFLIVNDKAIIAFITKRKKFTACESFTDITTSVSCKSVSGLDNITLPSSSSNSSSNSTGTATTASGGAANTTAAAASNATTTAAPASNTTAAPAASNTTAAASNATSASNSSGGTNNGSALIFPLKTSPVSTYPKYTEVFGVAVFGHSSISDAKFQHVASVLAEWLDNDEDGCADIPLVVSKMTTTSPKPFTLAERDNGEMTNAEGEAFESAGFQPSSVTYNSELLPACAGVAANDNCADATLEEVLHMVTDKGYMPAFPSTFSTEVNSNSLLTAAMDVARGGKFTTIPSSYPASAWYTYNDATCDYRCMATEYVYWGMSAYVGSLAGRKSSIANEWKFSTKAELLAGDVKLSAILQDTSSYRAPSVAPDGKYRAPITCASGAASGATVA